MSRFLVGIDLGTTNTVTYYIDKNKDLAEPLVFSIPQIVEFGEEAEYNSLPSFIYIPDEKEVPEGGLDISWKKNPGYSVGKFARKLSTTSPSKVVSSAKSWLCVNNIDKLSPTLPWNRDNTDKQISPVNALEKILSHIKNVWNYKINAENDEDVLENQTVVLTVPASFDAAARELTLKAAEKAGLNVILLEEPQASIYSWLKNKKEEWRNKLAAEDIILVCDIGGGTTDFSLLKAENKEGNLQLERIAVGDHILLGGDNMDLTMAFAAADKIKKEHGNSLSTYQITGLTHACRQAKEKLMNDDSVESQELTVLGQGSKLVGGTISTELTRKELDKTIMNGFFPECNIDDKPVQNIKAGLKTFGLNYESDPAITKHLAAFLSKHCSTDEGMPNCIIFNGGVSRAPKIRERIISTISSWNKSSEDKIKVLSEIDPDLAVSHGASYYGEVRSGKGIRIKAGSPHSYYLGVESSMPAIPGFNPPIQGLCVLQLGTEEGSSGDIDYSGLGLIVGETTEFRFFSSTSDESKLGDIVENAEENEDLKEMPPVKTTLGSSEEIPPGSLIPVKLRYELTETGTMQIWCISEKYEAKWKLNFELRGNTINST